MDVEEALRRVADDLVCTDELHRVLAVEVWRYRNVEASLRARCASVERGRVGGGVLCSDLPTHELRSAFGWPGLPEEVDR